jgi:hypothetical protein
MKTRKRGILNAFPTTAICTVLDVLYLTLELFPQPSASSYTWIYIEVSAQWGLMEADAAYSESVRIHLPRVFPCFFVSDQSTNEH